eukprot:SAG22_NODE_82_length_21749_cov_10.719769_12_plen_401_part_00
MIRKLMLVGMLVVAGRGSVAQLFLAIVISFASFSLQVKLTPYRHAEDNVLKAAVEIHIFLLVSIALVLKSLRGEAEGEVVPELFYDIMLVASFLCGIPLAFLWAVGKKKAMMEQALREAAVTVADQQSAAARQRAIRLLQLGLTSNDDMRLLAQYFAKLDALVNKSSHVFISYRVASDRQLARRVYDLLTEMTLDDTDQKLRVYLDQTRLEDGQRWDSGFMEGLANAMVFVPIVSVGSVGPMRQLGGGGEAGEDWADNVLLEWTAALELHSRGRVKAVLPLLVGESDFFADAHTAFGGIQALPTKASAATMEKVTMHLSETTGDDSIAQLRELLQQVSGQAEPTVQACISALLRFQGVKLSQGAQLSHGHGHLSVGMDDLGECTRRVQETVSSCMKQVGS